MKNITSTKTQFLISLSSDELLAMANALNEVINNSDIDDCDCSTRIGIGYGQLKELHESTTQILEENNNRNGEIFEAWKYGESIQIRAISAYGDPADLGYEEVKETILKLMREKDQA